MKKEKEIIKREAKKCRLIKEAKEKGVFNVKKGRRVRIQKGPSSSIQTAT